MHAIEHLEIEDVDVWFLMPDGSEKVGHATFTPSGQPRYRISIGGGDSIKLPRSSMPKAWRPVDPEIWPEALPPVMDTASTDVGIESYETDDQAFGWPYPGLSLGSTGAAPLCQKETEARILRYIRTARVKEYEPVKVDSAWPGDLMVKSKKRHLELASARSGKLPGFRKEDYDDFFVDESDDRPLPARWMPTPRDVSDWEWTDGPRTWIVTEQELWKKRAALPPWSWRQIADTMRQPHIVVYEAFQTAIKHSHRRATRGKH